MQQWPSRKKCPSNPEANVEQERGTAERKWSLLSCSQLHKRRGVPVVTVCQVLPGNDLTLREKKRTNTPFRHFFFSLPCELCGSRCSCPLRSWSASRHCHWLEHREQEDKRMFEIIALFNYSKNKLQIPNPIKKSSAEKLLKSERQRSFDKQKSTWPHLHSSSII